MKPTPSDADVLAVLHRAVDAAVTAMEPLEGRRWGLVEGGAHPGQYECDIVVDPAVLAVIDDAGFGALSEESGLHAPERGIVVVVDPVDGSTNASRGLPWYNTSLCAVDDDGPLAAIVANLATGARYEAVRGQGASVAGQPLEPRAITLMKEAIVGLQGYPPRHLGWKQFRALGSAALDLAAVGAGILDGYVDCLRGSLAPWDYMAGMLLIQEAGAHITEAFGRDLVVIDPGQRRAPVAACTKELLDELLELRRSF